MLTAIAAISENQILGKDNTLLWHLPNDFKRFKKLTTGHTIIMGRKTFESLPGVLPNRAHIVLSKNSQFRNPNVHLAHSVTEALELCKKDSQPFVIGGGEIYTLFFSYIKKIELTIVHTKLAGDTVFPSVNPKEWRLIFQNKQLADNKHLYAYTFETYLRR